MPKDEAHWADQVSKRKRALGRKTQEVLQTECKELRLLEGELADKAGKPTCLDRLARHQVEAMKLAENKLIAKWDVVFQEDKASLSDDIKAVLRKHGWFPGARLVSPPAMSLDTELTFLAVGGAKPPMDNGAGAGAAAALQGETEEGRTQGRSLLLERNAQAGADLSTT